jgi:Holliday junction resolvasome RuvABC endonuclease subunit
LKKQLHFNGHATDFEEYKLSDAIDAMVGEFDNAVQQIRDWFQENMELEIDESTQRANAAGVAFTDAIQKLMQDLATLAGELLRLPEMVLLQLRNGTSTRPK